MSEIIWQDTFLFSVNDDFIEPWVPDPQQDVTIKCKFYRSNPITHIYLRCAPEGSGRHWTMQAEPGSEDDFYVTYTITIPMRWQRFAFRFVVVTDSEVFWFNQRGCLQYEPPAQHDFVLLLAHNTPAWVFKSVFYQIFPDRFANGNPALDHQPGKTATSGESITVKAWGDQPEGGFDFFGGDIEGITQRIDHLTELGVNAIYLNPIFLAPSNHRYDLEDYFSIDPHLGDEQTFVKLVDTLHDREIKIILDGVFNHVGWGHRWFNRFGRFETQGAYQSEQSEYADFFSFQSHPDKYVGWFGFDSLPKLNFQSQKLRDYLYGASDSVMKFWLAEPYKLDGWRFDVANMTARYGTYQAGIEVWREVKASVRADYPDAYLLGEHFYDGSDLCQGDALDGVMNYMGFYYPVLYWLRDKVDFAADGQREHFPTTNYSGCSAQAQMAEYFAQIPEQQARSMLNLLTSHDRPRLNTLLEFNEDKLRAARFILFAYCGAPSIYYGDEIGLAGGDDPDCRRTMPWNREEWDESLFAEYQALISLRITSATLQHGALKWILITDDLLVFARIYQNDIILCVAPKNAANASEIDIPLWKIGVNNSKFSTLIGETQQYQCLDGTLRIPQKPLLMRLQ